MDKYEVEVSHSGEIIRADIERWLRNQVTFLAPLVMLYVGFVIARIQELGVELVSFIPSPQEITAMVLYLLNAIYDLLRKFVQEKTY